MSSIPFPTPAAVVDGTLAGSQAAEDALHAIMKPLIGAATPTAQTIAQLNTRFDGTPGGAVSQPVFPTVQHQHS